LLILLTLSSQKLAAKRAIKVKTMTTMHYKKLQTKAQKYQQINVYWPVPDDESSWWVSWQVMRKVVCYKTQYQAKS